MGGFELISRSEAVVPTWPLKPTVQGDDRKVSEMVGGRVFVCTFDVRKSFGMGWGTEIKEIVAMY